jgi:hypothetical protein
LSEAATDGTHNRVGLLDLLLIIGVVMVPTGAVEAARHAKLGILWCRVIALLGSFVGVLNGWAMWRVGG